MVLQNRILRDAICMLIESDPDLRIAAATDSYENVPELFVHHGADFLVIDAAEPEDADLEAIRGLRAADPGCRIIGLAPDEWNYGVAEARNAGVTDILPMDAIGDRLLPLIHSAQPALVDSR